MIRILCVALVALLSLGGCAGAPSLPSQESVDQAFGKVKIGLTIYAGVVSLYNVMPVCSETSLPPPLCYNQQIADIANIGLNALSAATESAEKVFAAGNSSTSDRERYTALAQEALNQLIVNLTKYGLIGLRQVT